MFLIGESLRLPVSWRGEEKLGSASVYSRKYNIALFLLRISAIQEKKKKTVVAF